MALMVQTMVFTYSLSSVSSNKYEFYRGAATSVGAVNGRDERRTSAPPLTAPPGLALGNRYPPAKPVGIYSLIRNE